jgi:hypothetical protein
MKKILSLLLTLMYTFSAHGQTQPEAQTWAFLGVRQLEGNL